MITDDYGIFNGDQPIAHDSEQQDHGEAENDFLPEQFFQLE